MVFLRFSYVSHYQAGYIPLPLEPGSLKDALEALRQDLQDEQLRGRPGPQGGL